MKSFKGNVSKVQTMCPTLQKETTCFSTIFEGQLPPCPSAGYSLVLKRKFKLFSTIYMKNNSCLHTIYGLATTFKYVNVDFLSIGSP